MSKYGLNKGVNDLATIYPEVAAQWDPDRNGDLTPSDVLSESVTKVWWRCELGHSWRTSVHERTSGNGDPYGCPYCSNHRVLSGFNDLATKYPEIAAQWDPDRNGNLTPSEVLPGARASVWWRCSLGHNWKTAVAARVSGRGCPYCSNRRVLPGFNDLATIHPEIAAQWDTDRNGDITPSDVMPGSITRVWWRCSQGHSWLTSVGTRSKGYGCPYCSNRKVLPGYNDLATRYPEIAAQWDYERNTDFAPDKIPPHFMNHVWWRCEQGHSWSATVVSRVAQGRDCPFCSGHKVLKGFNDLATTHPLLAVEWDFEKNGNLTPESVSKGSNKLVYWRCRLGHSWSASVGHRAISKSGCPYCSGNIVLPGFNDLKTVNPELADQWDIEKNGSLSPDQVTEHSGRRVWWICIRGHSWRAAVASRSGGRGCPFCTGRKVIPGENDLATIRPRLVAEWNAEKNGSLTPDKVHSFSSKKVWWKDTLGHEWLATISDRSRGNGCPYCAGDRVLPGFNDLATTAPQLLQEWDFEKNRDIHPTQLTYKSEKKVWWKCVKNHHWRTSPLLRMDGSGCPFCYGATPKRMRLV